MAQGETNMTTLSSQTTINKPASEVFAFLTDVKNHLSWQPMLKEARIEPDGAPAVGSVYHYMTEVMGQKYPSQMEITAFEQDRLWKVGTTSMPNPVYSTYQFEDQGGSTLLTISMELSGGYPAAAEAAIKQQTQKTLDDQCTAIKAQMGG